MQELIGKAVVALHVGAAEARPGLSMPGIAGATWFYADAFVSLEGDGVLCLSPGEIAVAFDLPRGARSVDLLDDAGRPCLGRRIVDLVQVDTETHLVVLDDGRYLANTFEPGGTRFAIGTFDTWAPDELRAQSMVSGYAVDLAHYVKGASLISR